MNSLKYSRSVRPRGCQWAWFNSRRLGRTDFAWPRSGKRKTVFGRATNFTGLARQPFEIRLSRAPKTEVAHGLVLDTKDRTEAPEWDWAAEEETHPPLLAGENYTSDNRECGWNTYLSTDSRLTNVRIARDLPQLQTLLKNLKIEADGYLLNTCAGAVNNELEDAAHDKGARHLEPPFITALKTMLRHRAEEWANMPLSEKER